MIEDITGKSALAIDVFALSIQALKDHLMETLDKRGIKMTVKDIRWVLTVPAIWTDAAKQFMRKSAEKVNAKRYNRSELILGPVILTAQCELLVEGRTLNCLLLQIVT